MVISGNGQVIIECDEKRNFSRERTEERLGTLKLGTEKENKANVILNEHDISSL